MKRISVILGRFEGSRVVFDRGSSARDICPRAFVLRLHFVRRSYFTKTETRTWNLSSRIFALKLNIDRIHLKFGRYTERKNILKITNVSLVGAKSIFI